MFRIKKLHIFFFLVFITISLPALSEVRLPEIPSTSQPLSISLQTEFFRTQANYISFGQYADLAEEDFFKYISFRPSLSYSPFKHYISFTFFANGFYADSKKGNLEYQLPFSLSMAGAGVSFYHKINTSFIGLELRGGIPLYKNFQSATEIIVGDGAYFAEPGLWFIFKPSKVFHIYNRNSFRWRSSGLSSLVFSSLGGVIESEFISAGLALDAFFSLIIFDSFSSQPEQRLSLLKTANASSQKFYSVNPSVISGTAWTEFKFKPFFATLYVNLDTIGENYAKGFSLGFITKFKWSSKTSFIDKKRKSKSYLNFTDLGGEEEEPSPRQKEESDYFEEEDDNSLFPEENSKSMNQELKDELNLLTED